MTRTDLIRFAILGAVGFGAGWAIAAVLLVNETFRPWAFFVGGACGGATLGLALGDWKRTAVLTLAGTLGCGAAFYLSLVAVDFVLWLDVSPYSTYGKYALVSLYLFVFTGPAVGMFGGTALSLTFGDWKKSTILTLVGLVGFGVGESIADALQSPLFGAFLYSQQALLQGAPMWTNALDEAIRGAVGGASLGAVFGYLEKRELAEG